MANHVRRQLREAVAGAVTGLITTGSNVFQSRIYPLQTRELPGLRVHTDEETLQLQLDRSYQRDVTVTVEGIARAAADLDDTLDAIAKEVETALGVSISVGAKSVLLALTAIAVELSDEAERPTGSISLTYQATIFSAPGQPDVLL